jgi:hypothetical protein
MKENNNVFVNAIIISVLFFLLRIIENKILSKEEIKIKLILKDTLMVFFSIIIGDYLIIQLAPLIYDKPELLSNPIVFTDNPSF